MDAPFHPVGVAFTGFALRKRRRILRGCSGVDELDPIVAVDVVVVFNVQELNVTAPMDLPGTWINSVHECAPLDKLTPDLDSSQSETYGARAPTRIRLGIPLICTVTLGWVCIRLRGSAGVIQEKMGRATGSRRVGRCESGQANPHREHGWMVAALSFPDRGILNPRPAKVKTWSA